MSNFNDYFLDPIFQYYVNQYANKSTNNAFPNSDGHIAAFFDSLYNAKSESEVANVIASYNLNYGVENFFPLTNDIDADTLALTTQKLHHLVTAQNNDLLTDEERENLLSEVFSVANWNEYNQFIADTYYPQNVEAQNINFSEAITNPDIVPNAVVDEPQPTSPAPYVITPEALLNQEIAILQNKIQDLQNEKEMWESVLANNPIPELQQAAVTRLAEIESEVAGYTNGINAYEDYKSEYLNADDYIQPDQAEFSNTPGLFSVSNPSQICTDCINLAEAGLAGQQARLLYSSLARNRIVTSNYTTLGSWLIDRLREDPTNPELLAAVELLNDALFDLRQEKISINEALDWFNENGSIDYLPKSFNTVDFSENLLQLFENDIETAGIVRSIFSGEESPVVSAAVLDSASTNDIESGSIASQNFQKNAWIFEWRPAIPVGVVKISYKDFIKATTGNLNNASIFNVLNVSSTGARSSNTSVLDSSKNMILPLASNYLAMLQDVSITRRLVTQFLLTQNTKYYQVFTENFPEIRIQINVIKFGNISEKVIDFFDNIVKYCSDQRKYPGSFYFYDAFQENFEDFDKVSFFEDAYRRYKIIPTVINKRISSSNNMMVSIEITGTIVEWENNV